MCLSGKRMNNVCWATAWCQAAILSSNMLIFTSITLFTGFLLLVGDREHAWEQGSCWANQLLRQEVAPVGQNFLTPQSIFSRQRARFQIGLDQIRMNFSGFEQLQAWEIAAHDMQRIPAERFLPDAPLSILPSYLAWKETHTWRTFNLRWHPSSCLSTLVVKTLRCADSLNHRSPQ